MRQVFTFLALLVCSFLYGQDKFPRDTIRKFSLSLETDYYLPIRGMKTTISEDGKVCCTYYFSNQKKQKRDTIANKFIQLDSNTFRQVKESIITMGLDTLPSKYDDTIVSDGQYYNLKIMFNGKQYILQGSNRDSSEPPFKNLIEYLEKLIGLIAIDYEND